jgi:hypothetical protein
VAGWPKVLRNTHGGATGPRAQTPATRHDAAAAPPQRLLPLSALAAPSGCGGRRATTAADPAYPDRIRSASIAAKPIVSPSAIAVPCSLAWSATAAATAGETSRLKTEGTM